MTFGTSGEWEWRVGSLIWFSCFCFSCHTLRFHRVRFDLKSEQPSNHTPSGRRENVKVGRTTEVLHL